MVFLPAIIVLVPYFDKKRAIATGIATSGSGLGTFAYGWIMDQLLEVYNWRGTILILSGLLLNSLIFGLLFRPIETKKSKKMAAQNNRLQSLDRSMKSPCGDDTCQENLLTHTNGAEDHFLQVNGVCKAIPEVSSPTKTIDVSVCRDIPEKTKISSQTAAENNAQARTIDSSSSSYNAMLDVSKTETQPQVFCDAKTPVVWGGETDFNTSSDDRQPSHHVTKCAGAHEPNNETGNGNASSSNVPSITNTPPSPATFPNSNRYSLDIAQLYSASTNSKPLSSQLCNLSESNIKDRCKQSSSDVLAQLVASNHVKEHTVNNNTAVIIPTSDICVNSNGEKLCEQTSVALSPTKNNEILSTVGERLSQQGCGIAKLKDENSLSSNLLHHKNTDSVPETSSVERLGGLSSEDKPGGKAGNADAIDAYPKSPPLHLRPFWRVQEPSVGKFTVARIYSSDDHINSAKPRSGADSKRNSHCDDDMADGSSKNHTHASRKVPKQNLLSPLVAMELGKSQTVSLYGINGYRSQHPHHHDDDHPNIRNRHHHHHHHHHSFYELGGSRVEIVDNLSNGVPARIPRASSTHLAAYHYFGSMASFGAAVTRNASTENVDVIRNSTDNKNSNSCRAVLNRWFPTRLLGDPLFLFLLMGFVMWTST
ncbi:monocarboxylate transporter 12 [Elysia marginata]|uniref:Monocarboxylate transporter 12 n=1 Tax=Elysia marginata TaxID=1093978 RepID=A0AAV4GH80_9GAST|nr:monocarboxylate transporter 12 [Elysia marginata]